MPEQPDATRATPALRTALEEQFIAPLTAVRGALEILRDFPDLSPDERRRFVDTALEGCERLGAGVEQLGESVYAAARRSARESAATPDESAYAERIHMLDEHDTVEVDLSGFEFSSAALVDEFHDALDARLERSGRRWYFLVNFRDCRVWPEAWVAFAHRGQKSRATYSLGAARYVEGADPAQSTLDADTFASRAEALAHIDALRRGGGTRQTSTNR